MRTAIATIFVLLLLAVVFIVLNLKPATISFFGLVSITQPLGVIVSMAFIVGAWIVYFVKAGAELRQTWRERPLKKASQRFADAANYYQAGLEALVEGSREEARRSFERVISQDPEHVGALLALGNIEREAGEIESAIKRHIKANSRKPGSPDILKALSEDYAEAGRVDECIRALDDLLALSPSNKYALSKKRDVFESYDRLDKAIEAQQALIKAGSTDRGRLIALRLKAALNAEAADKARFQLKAALQQDKKCVAAYRLLGETYWREDNISEATKAWKGGWKATRDSSMLKRLCEAYLASGQGKKALKLSRQAKDASPSDPLPALMYAITAYQLEDLRGAETALASQSLASNPAAALLRLEISRRVGDSQTLDSQTRDALSALRSLSKPYECGACGDFINEWMPQCPSCNNWDTIRMTSAGYLDIPLPMEVEAPVDKTAAEQSDTQ